MGICWGGGSLILSLLGKNPSSKLGERGAHSSGLSQGKAAPEIGGPSFPVDRSNQKWLWLKKVVSILGPLDGKKKNTA